eukprot:CAMPEP_0119361094 /NCGR_PEP_ID=MMETSP1334-20130426/8501_1 /TAXON_ID=127549 /ORGANISM="Calcidiscus leptoporus, Strain RCC1130" /LENGTH=95 /DNA_ID=CAMNT_0007376031 /DNA_START=171 /DNA_END=458 /DNA_ORIENTATION=-
MKQNIWEMRRGGEYKDEADLPLRELVQADVIRIPHVIVDSILAPIVRARVSSDRTAESEGLLRRRVSDEIADAVRVAVGIAVLAVAAAAALKGVE